MVLLLLLCRKASVGADLAPPAHSIPRGRRHAHGGGFHIKDSLILKRRTYSDACGLRMVAPQRIPTPLTQDTQNGCQPRGLPV